MFLFLVYSPDETAIFLGWGGEDWCQVAINAVYEGSKQTDETPRRKSWIK